jgi:hypothetical protein
MAIKVRLEAFRLAIEELQSELRHASDSGNRDWAVDLEKEIEHENLRTLLNESIMEWEQLKSDVEAAFSNMKIQIDSLQATRRREGQTAQGPAAIPQRQVLNSTDESK